MAKLSATVMVGNTAAFWWTKRKPEARARAGVMSAAVTVVPDMLISPASAR